MNFSKMIFHNGNNIFSNEVFYILHDRATEIKSAVFDYLKQHENTPTSKEDLKQFRFNMANLMSHVTKNMGEESPIDPQLPTTTAEVLWITFELGALLSSDSLKG